MDTGTSKGTGDGCAEGGDEEGPQCRMKRGKTNQPSDAVVEMVKMMVKDDEGLKKGRLQLELRWRHRY